MIDWRFLDDAGDAVAVLARGLLVQRLEHLLEPFDLLPRFLEVRLERVPQLQVSVAALAIFGSALVNCFSAS